MLSGTALLVAGASLASRSTDASLATGAGAVAFDHWIGHEETNLTHVFGHDYRRYQQQTPRWLGIPRQR